MKTTLGIFSTHAEAEEALKDLMAAGISGSDLSYLYLNRDDQVINKTTGAAVSSEATRGAVAGTALGALAGLVVANGVLPGLGTLFVAGPLATALGLSGAAATTVAGAATGLAAGGLLGALVGYGVNQADAAMYEKHIQAGDVLVSVKTDATFDAKDILMDAGAREVRSYSK